MKRIYHFYLTCMTLTLTMPMMIVSVFAVDDMWTVANNIIVDVYGKIVGVSTVLAGLMSAVAVIGAKLSNNQHKVDQTHLDRLGNHQRHRRIHCICCAAVQRPCDTDPVKVEIAPAKGGVHIA